MPAWMAPVFIVMPMKPPMTRMNRATSMAPNSSPVLNDVDVAGRRILDAVEAVDRRLERVDDDPLRGRVDLLVRARDRRALRRRARSVPAGMIQVADAP